jgi:hypothetical protein
MGRESFADRLLQSGKVVFDGDPDGFVAEAIVGVPQDVSHTPDFAPVRPGAQGLVFGKCISGPLKDTDCLAIGARTHRLLQPGRGGEIDLRAEQVAETNPKAAEGEQRDARAGIEVGKEVDVGVGSGFAARDRAEEAQVREASRLQFRGVAAQDREDAVGVHF